MKGVETCERTSRAALPGGQENQVCRTSRVRSIPTQNQPL
jgi:hypothetical protein